MTRRATFTQADRARLKGLVEEAKAAGMRLEMEVDGRRYIADPRETVPASEPDSALDRWLGENGGRVAGAA